MKNISDVCVDAGTVNCPCPLAETGDCLICSRLAGEDKCDCSWCGLCIYNEFIQNRKKLRNRRQDLRMPIVSKRWYEPDLMLMEVKTGRGFAMEGSRPGAFVFLNSCEDPFYNVPVSILRTDLERGTVSFLVKVHSSKTKALAQEKESVIVRGVYRNGLLGKGDISSGKRWLIFSRGTGIVPAVNLLSAAKEDVYADMIIDVQTITRESAVECLECCKAVKSGRVKIEFAALQQMLDKGVYGGTRRKSSCNTEDYDKVFIMASDYYIDKLKSEFEVPERKLVVANNFHMCCGEGICGACCHVDEYGKTHKMCKCRQKK